jgi:hypothetical protein
VHLEDVRHHTVSVAVEVEPYPIRAGLDVNKEDDLITVAQFHVNERRSRHQINQALIHEFATRAKLTVNHKLLASLPVRTYWNNQLRHAHRGVAQAGGQDA